MPELVERLQVGKREDLADVIAVVDAKTCPFISMVPKGTELTNALMEWQMDNYPDPAFDGVVDNQDVTVFENLSEGRVGASNYIQIFERKPKVSRLAQNVSDVAGIGKKKEMAKQVAKGLVMIKRDMESAFCSDHDAQADDGAVGYRTRGAGSWITNTAQTVLPVNVNYRTPTGSLNNTAMASLTETLVNDLLESIYDQTGVNKTMILLCGTKLKRRFTEFSIYQPSVSATVGTLRTYNQEGNRKIVASIDFLEGDFGSLELHPSKFLAKDASTAAQARRGYVLDMDMFELRYNTMPNFRPLEDQGGGPRGLIEAIAGLVCKSPLGLGKFYATT
jgi:hypothetical protein